MKLYLSLIFSFCLMALASNANAQNLSSEKGITSLGAGVGLPYGGIIGLKLNHNLEDNFSAFGGIGYNFLGVGFNAGLNYTIPSFKSTELYFTGMYGYNALIDIEGVPEYQKVYYGASVGTGLKINSLRYEGRYWDFGILVPLRNAAYRNDLEAIENDPFITIDSKPLPIQFYFGYNIPINARKKN
jgi:hypothetical protein